MKKLGVPATPLASNGQDDEGREAENRRGARIANQAQNRHPVLAALGIVVVAEKQHLVGDGSDLAF